MNIRDVPIERVKPYSGNPRNNAAVIDKVAASLAEFGWQQPIVVDREFVVVAGHTRLAAAQKLGHATVPVVVADALSPAQVRAYRLADNRVGQDAEWDDDKLAVELAALEECGYNLTLTGFTDSEIGVLLTGHAGGLLPGVDPDDVPAPPETLQTRRGDVYEMGPHRLVCGDATDRAAWDALMRDDLGAMVWTDPPYGVAYVGQRGMKIANDDLPLEETANLLRASLGLAAAFTSPGSPWYVAAPHGPAFLAFATVGHELGWWRQTLVWVKDVFALGRSDYHYRHEALMVGEQTGADGPVRHYAPIGYGWHQDGAHLWHGGRKQDTVWEVPKPRANRDHPTMKPVALIERAINNSSDPGAIVIDPFGGSGSTLIACEEVNRAARLLELDERYCDVIVARWEAATGRVARRTSV